MWVKFRCWLLGHKIMLKAFTGETMERTDRLGGTYTAAMYHWRRQECCARCGKRIKEEAE